MPRRKSDPLIGALIAKLPQPGNEWPVDQQLAWLRLMAMAFGAVYGGDASQQMGGSGAPLAPAKPTLKPAVESIEHPFYIDRNSYARKKGGKRILAKDVTDALVDMRGIDGDVETIIWADDSTGLANAPSIIIEAA